MTNQQFKATESRRSSKPRQGAACFDCLDDALELLLAALEGRPQADPSLLDSPLT